MLSDDEKRCFARFAVFAGGATVEAAETITAAGLDTLDGLVTKSLLARRQHAPAPTRLAMLETIRAYASERFASAADVEAVRERHYRLFLALAERHGSDRLLWGTSRKEHIAYLDADIDNLQAALAWKVEQAATESALALCAALGWYWLMRYRYADAVDSIDQALSLPAADAHPALRIRTLRIKAWALWPLGRRVEQRAVVLEAEGIARALADPVLLSQVLQARSIYEAHAGAHDVADTLADEALRWARAAGDEWATAMAAYARAMAAGGAAELRVRVDQAASLLDQAGNVYQLADLLAGASYAALCEGSCGDASDFVTRATPIARQLDDPYLWMLLRGNAALTALLTGDTNAARAAFGEELRLSRELVALPFASEGLAGLAAVAVLDLDLDRARETPRRCQRPSPRPAGGRR